MTEKEIVKFTNPENEDEITARMVVIEMRGERCLVSDLRFANYSVPPTAVYLVSDLEVVNETR